MLSASNESNIENQLWETANVLRGSMDPADYSNVVLGLIFLKYISDSFEEEHSKLEHSEYPEDAESKLAYTAHSVFWVPKESRWSVISSAAKNSMIGKIIDTAMEGIENENSQLKGILPKNYESPDLNTSHLGEVIDLISNVKVGTKEAQSKDVLGQVYEYFLKKFALQEGHRGGDFYTPRSIVRTLVEMIEPYKGRVYDPCCGSGGMFVQSQAFIKEHRGNTNDISIYGQESNPKTWKLCKMNLAIRGMGSDLGPHSGDTLADDLHKGIHFDYVLANPPFNMDWNYNKLKDDPRWKYGVPSTGKRTANYIWLQHVISKLSPHGKAGIVLANGALSTNSSNQFNIRKNIINSGKLDAIVLLPSKMFYSVTIPASLWIINNKKNHKNRILFIDASDLGYMVDRTHRNFSMNDIHKISHAYHNYCKNDGYNNEVNFCKSVSIKDVKDNNYVLIPGRYIDVKRKSISQNKLKKKIINISNILLRQLNKSNKISNRIKSFVKDINNE